MSQNSGTVDNAAVEVTSIASKKGMWDLQRVFALLSALLMTTVVILFSWTLFNPK
jgi:hypothetical protein